MAAVRRFGHSVLSFGALAASAALATASGWSRPPAAAPQERSARGVAVVSSAGVPELHVDGRPYFPHAALFPYYRIPRDLWESSLDRYRTLGINTIELVIPWSWHQPAPQEPDFDGRSHPRRDLRALLRMMAERGFRLAVRLGAAVDRDLRAGGLPDWAAGSTPTARPSAGAFDTWLDAVARELAPWQASRSVFIPASAEERTRQGASGEREAGGPLILVQLDETDDAAAAPLPALAEILRRAGIEVPVVAGARDETTAASASGIPVRGQWFAPHPDGAPPAAAERRIGGTELASLTWAAAQLHKQALFPPLLAAVAAGWPAPADDARPPESRPENLLLATRLLLAQGVKGFTYWPLQDSLTPAGWSAAGVNRHYRWDAPLALSGEPQFRARVVERNGRMAAAWGEQLARSHRRADLAIVWAGAAPDAAADVEKLLRLAVLAGLTAELIDPAQQPPSQWMRHPVVLLPVPAGDAPLAETVQRALAAYVRAGGTLVWFPRQPAGGALAELLAGEPVARGPDDATVTAAWRAGAGLVLESTKNFFSWVDPRQSLAAGRAAFESAWGTRALHEFLAHAGVEPAVRRPTLSPSADRLLAVQHVTNAEAGPLGARRGGAGLLSLVNLSYDEPAEETLSLLPPTAGARDRGAERIELRVQVPPREALLLPLAQPLCAAAPPGQACTDAVIAAGAELLRAERDGRNLLLSFYTPARAQVRLRLARPPRRVSVAGLPLLHTPLDAPLQEMRPEFSWDANARVLEFDLPRGAAPEFLRLVSVQLDYVPAVPERPDPSREKPTGVASWFVDSVRLPLGEDASLPTDPALFLLSADLEGEAVVAVENLEDRGLSVDLRVAGAVRGSRGSSFGPRETRFLRVGLRPEGGGSPAGAPDQDGLYRGEFELRARGESKTFAAAFAVIRPEAVTPYRFDFDRDGNAEWVLENPSLRLVVSPEEGGEVLALVDKRTQLNVTTTAGAFRDGLLSRGENELLSLRERPYRAEWVSHDGQPALQLSYALPDGPAAGAQIAKTFRIVGRDEVAVDYRVRQAAGAAYSFFTAVSLPALLRGPGTTGFCFGKAAATATEDRAAAEDAVCATFEPGGAPLRSAEGATRLEVRMPGQVTVALEWPAGARASVEMKRHSALVRIVFPAPQAGEAAGVYPLRLLLLPAPPLFPVSGGMHLR